MSNNHILTKKIGNLRGISTDSLYLRPANVASEAKNIQRAPDGTLQIRRGYQCQIANIGGLGIGSFDNPSEDTVLTCCIGLDGFLYNKLTRQIFMNYDGRITGAISNVTNPSADLTNIVSNSHGLQTGAQVIIRNVGGATQLNNPSTFSMVSYNFYSITVTDANNFILDGIPFSQLSAYTSGGTWSVAFADRRYLTFSIYVDPQFIYAISNQSINAKVIENRAAQVNGNQLNVNIIQVQYGSSFSVGNGAQFYDSLGRFQQRNVTGITPYSITVDGPPVSVTDSSYIDDVYIIPFGKGFDAGTFVSVGLFISNITDPVLGIPGLTIDVNGRIDVPAAFLQILESVIIPSGGMYTMDYWYWEQVNATINPPFPGSANPLYQNSPDFENASMAAFDDIVIIANGWDYPQKYDGQTVYRTGMPIGGRPSAADNTTYASKPFVTDDLFEYAITYEQIDNRGHLVEGEISEIFQYKVSAANAAINVTVTNLQSTPGNNWNTNCALATGGTATVYGPDSQGYYYDFVPVTVGFTLKIGDSAYYYDQTCAVMSGATTNGFTLPVNAGHGILPGDVVYFINSSNQKLQRVVSSVTATSVTVTGAPFTTNPTTAFTSNVRTHKVSEVFGNVAIVDGAQNNVNAITVLTGHNVSASPGDVVQFIDSNGNMQQRTVTATGATSVTVDGNPVSLLSGALIASTNQRTNSITLRRLNANGVTTIANEPISNNLRINIYRTKQGESFGVNGELYLVDSVPNNSLGAATNTYVDAIADAELGRQFDDPDQFPNPPPISKYVKAFGNQMFYAGGERLTNENSDRVFFSDGNSPEVVPLATNFFNVPNVDDDVTGIGVSGSTFITTKNHSLWAATGNFLSGQIDVVQIAPGTNIGCVAHATIASVGTLMYFVHTNGVYAITENQLFPTDAFGNPIPISLAIDEIFRETRYLPYTRYVFKRAVAFNYTKDNQYLLFLPCEDSQSTIRTANGYSNVLCYDYQEKNWFPWDNINAAGGFVVIEDDLYWQERRFSRVDGNTANLYKQHRFYRLIDHADHAGAQVAEWISSWEDLGQPEVRKKFSRCMLLMDRVSELLQYNNPVMEFTTYLNRIPNLKDTISQVTQVDNTRNSGWSTSPWGWNYWSGYQDSFISIALRQGTVAKSMSIGLRLSGINMDIRLAGFQLEAIPENRNTFAR